MKYNIILNNIYVYICTTHIHIQYTYKKTNKNKQKQIKFYRHPKNNKNGTQSNVTTICTTADVFANYARCQY